MWEDRQEWLAFISLLFSRAIYSEPGAAWCDLRRGTISTTVSSKHRSVFPKSSATSPDLCAWHSSSFSSHHHSRTCFMPDLYSIITPSLMPTHTISTTHLWQSRIVVEIRPWRSLSNRVLLGVLVECSRHHRGIGLWQSAPWICVTARASICWGMSASIAWCVIIRQRARCRRFRAVVHLRCIVHVAKAVSLLVDWRGWIHALGVVVRHIALVSKHARMCAIAAGCARHASLNLTLEFLRCAVGDGNVALRSWRLLIMLLLLVRKRWRLVHFC